MTDLHARERSASVEEAPAKTEASGRRQSATWLLRALAKLLTHCVFIAVILGAWQFASGRWISSFVFSKPSSVGSALWDWVTTATFWGDVRTTFEEMLLGFVLAAVAGTLLAFVLSELPRTRAFLSPYITALYGVPKSALAPLFIVWFGVGLEPKVVLSASLVFFLIFYNTLAGLLAIDTELLNLVKLNGATKLQVWRTLKLPATLPYWLTGVRIAMPMGLVGAIIGEYISSNKGVGFQILQASNFFKTDQVFAGLIVLCIIVLLLNAILGRIERHFLRWRMTN